MTKPRRLLDDYCVTLRSTRALSEWAKSFAYPGPRSLFGTWQRLAAKSNSAGLRSLSPVAMHANLRSFLDLLRRENDLASIDSEVVPYLEIAEIHRRVIARGGPALLFKLEMGRCFHVFLN